MKAVLSIITILIFSFVSAQNSSASSEKQKDYEATRVYFKPFNKTISYKIESVLAQENILNLKKNDIIKVSLKNGMIVYRNKKKYSQYKLIPETKDSKNYFRWNTYGVDIKKDKIEICKITNQQKEAPESGWKDSYKIKK